MKPSVVLTLLETMRVYCSFTFRFKIPLCERSRFSRLFFSNVYCVPLLELVAGGDIREARFDSRTKGENNRNRARRWGERGNDTAKCSVLKNVATGVDAIPSLNCLSWSIEVHGRNQAPFYPVHSRQRERWMDGAPRRR